LHLPLDWNLPRPEIIFSITGSAQPGEFDLGDPKGLQNWFKNRLHEFLARVIFGVAITKTGWIIDGGSNQGIMKALGNTRQHLMYPPLAPLIGMSSLNLKPLEGIETKHKPDSGSIPETQSPLSNATAPPSTEGKISHAATAAAKAGASESAVDGTPCLTDTKKPKPLPDPNHSHFFFVGPKTKGAKSTFSDENVFRRNFEVCPFFCSVAWHHTQNLH